MRLLQGNLIHLDQGILHPRIISPAFLVDNKVVLVLPVVLGAPVVLTLVIIQVLNRVSTHKAVLSTGLHQVLPRDLRAPKVLPVPSPVHLRLNQGLLVLPFHTSILNKVLHQLRDLLHQVDLLIQVNLQFPTHPLHLRPAHRHNKFQYRSHSNRRCQEHLLLWHTLLHLLLRPRCYPHKLMEACPLYKHRQRLLQQGLQLPKQVLPRQQLPQLLRRLLQLQALARVLAGHQEGPLAECLADLLVPLKEGLLVEPLEVHLGLLLAHHHNIRVVPLIQVTQDLHTVLRQANSIRPVHIHQAKDLRLL